DAEDEPGYRHALAGLPAVRLPDLGNRDGAEDERKERAQPVQPDDPENEARDREAVRARPPGDHDRRRIRRVGSVGGRRRIGLERRLGGWRNRARQRDRMGDPRRMDNRRRLVVNELGLGEVRGRSLGARSSRSHDLAYVVDDGGVLVGFVPTGTLCRGLRLRLVLERRRMTARAAEPISNVESRSAVGAERRNVSIVDHRRTVRDAVNPTKRPMPLQAPNHAAYVLAAESSRPMRHSRHMASGDPPVELVVTSGALAGERIPVSGELTIGRRAPDGLSLNEDSRVSRRHARIRLENGLAPVIEDLGSGNGTFVNGTRIEAERLLEDGDVVVLGTTVFEISMPASLDERPHEPETISNTVVQFRRVATI